MALSRRLLASLFIACALASFAYAQDGDNFGGQDAPQGDFDPEQFNTQQQEMIEMQRTKLWSCYFLTRNRLYSKSQEINDVVQGNKNGEALFKKMTTDVMKACLGSVQPEEAQQILGTLGQESFDLDTWNHLHNFNIDTYRGEDVPLELDGEDAYIYDYYKKIDESVKNQWEEQAEKEEVHRRKNVDFEPKIGGISIKNTSPFVKSLYLVGVSGAIIAIFYFAYRILFRDEETPYEKVKRERLQKKKGKAQ